MNQIWDSQSAGIMSYVIVDTSEYPNTTLHPSALACDRISIRISFHHVSRLSGSSGFGTRSSNLTERAATVAPKWSINPAGNLLTVKKGYSSISKFSGLSGARRTGGRWLAALKRSPEFREFPINGYVITKLINSRGNITSFG